MGWCKKAQGNPFTYASAKARLNGRTYEKLDNKSFLEVLDQSTIGLRLYDTVIVRYYRDGDIILDSGHYTTVATKDYMNTFVEGSPIESIKGLWTVINPKTGFHHYFNDGVTIYANGSVSTKALFIDIASEKLNTPLASEKEVISTIQNADTKTLKRLFRARGSELKSIVAQYAPIEFIPLIVIKSASDHEKWKDIAKARLA